MGLVCWKNAVAFTTEGEVMEYVRYMWGRVWIHDVEVGLRNIWQRVHVGFA